MSKTSAKIILDSVHPDVPSARITTIEYEAPRFLLAEINTHGVISRSAASSRAIPVEKRIEMARTGPFEPIVFGKNARGMQARGEVQGSKAIECHEVWDEARLAAIHAAARLADLEVHKQQANRILEPYVYVKGVMTATEWENFFALRYHADADPEFENLAREIHVAMKGSVPVARRVHLPYATDSEDCDGLDHDEKTMVSAARCARISYRLFDGALSNVAGDLDLCKRLLTSKHMSPFQHLAVADDLVYEDNSDIWAKWQNPQKHERYWGWVPIRFEIERQLGMKSRRSSFEKLRVDPSL